jgi:hypothetical protein
MVELSLSFDYGSGESLAVSLSLDVDPAAIGGVSATAHLAADTDMALIRASTSGSAGEVQLARTYDLPAGAQPQVALSVTSAGSTPLSATLRTPDGRSVRREGSSALALVLDGAEAV